MAVLPFVFRDVLRCGTTGLAGKLRESSLVDAVAPRRIEIDRANMLQAFNQAEHRDRLRCLRHVAQPSEPALAGFRPPPRQCIEPLSLFGRKPVGQSTLDLASCPIADLDTESFERARRRDDNAAVPTFLYRQFHQVGQPVVLNCMRQEPTGQLSSWARAEGTESKPVLKLRSVTPTTLLRGEIFIDGFRRDIDLLSNK